MKSLKKIILGAFLGTISVHFTIGQIVLQRCDYTNGWTSANTLSIDNDDKKEGVGSLVSTGSGTDWFIKTFSQAYTGIDSTGYLTFWTYISDTTQLTGDGQVEITSSGGPDTDEYSWPTTSLNLKNGWNEVQLKIADAGKSGNPDLEKINYFRLYQPLSGEITTKIDFIRFQDSLNETFDEILDIKKVDNSTLDGKVMFGYQGWFNHPDANAPFPPYWHYGDMSTGDPSKLNVDMFPDDREYDPDERYATGFNYPDGRVARVYSAYNRKTVTRHVKWLRDYDLDGVFLQRFIYETGDPRVKEFRDSTTAYIMDGCERYGRVFAMMWDGIGHSGVPQSIKDDWKHLVDNIKVTESPGYLHHRGRPLICLWGMIVYGDFTIEEMNDLIDFFHNNPEEKYRASVMMGGDQNWINNSAWKEALKNVEVISPWTVGRYGNSSYESWIKDIMLRSQTWCDENNVDFLPVIWPGFSWYNLHGGSKNQHPRNGGKYLYGQAHQNIANGAKSLYIAMFDELDESTAMFKCAENASQAPDKGYWLTLDADGHDLPSDWYLRCAGMLTDVIRGETNNADTLATPPDGLDVFELLPQHIACGIGKGSITISFPNHPDKTGLEFSIDGGNTYPYASPDSAGTYTITDLDGGLYNIWVRYSDGSYPTDLGDKLITNAEVNAVAKALSATCKDNGIINVAIADNPFIGTMDISIDGGNTYSTSGENEWSLRFDGLAPDNYEIWAKWTDKSCPAINITTLEVMEYAPDIRTYVIIDDKVYSSSIDTFNICLDTKFMLRAKPEDANLSWQWTGPNGFSSTLREKLLTYHFVEEMAGVYTVTYTDTSGCSKSKDIVVQVNCLDDISETSIENWNIFPNPCQDKLFIQQLTSIDITNSHISIYNILGKEVKIMPLLNKTVNDIDVSDLPDGIYMISITNNDKVVYQNRVMKK